MILECPNLKSACEDFLNDPDLNSGPGQEGQRTMWGFFMEIPDGLIHLWFTDGGIRHYLSPK
jgi:hypothetical protein